MSDEEEEEEPPQNSVDEVEQVHGPITQGY
jgi:hypothetical protein